MVVSNKFLRKNVSTSAASSLKTAFWTFDAENFKNLCFQQICTRSKISSSHKDKIKNYLIIIHIVEPCSLDFTSKKIDNSFIAFHLITYPFVLQFRIKAFSRIERFSAIRWKEFDKVRSLLSSGVFKLKIPKNNNGQESKHSNNFMMTLICCIPKRINLIWN